MKLNLSIYDPKKKKITIKEAIELKIDVKNIDDRWNDKREFEVPERLILELIENVLDKVVDMNRFKYNEGEKASSLKREITLNEANSILQSARAWKKIHVMISDQGYQTSRFTRLDLFEQLLNIPKMKAIMGQRIHEITMKSAIPKIPEETKSQIAPPNKETKISSSLFMEFINKSK